MEMKRRLRVGKTAEGIQISHHEIEITLDLPAPGSPVCGVAPPCTGSPGPSPTQASKVNRP
jgi:hypothetical protein